MRRGLILSIIVALALVLSGCEWDDIKAVCMGVGDSDHEDAELVEGDGSLEIDWANLTNPILADPDHSIKDQAVVYRDGVFHVFSSGGQYRSSDLKSWTRVGDGLGSPDVVEIADDEWMLVHQVRDEIVPGPDGDYRRLHYRTSTDLETWTSDRELIPDLPHDRNIDGAIAPVEDGFVLGFKSGLTIQRFNIAISPGPDAAGDWAWTKPAKAFPGEGCALDKWLPIIGDTITRWAENYQFIEIDGRKRMIATARHPNRPIDFGYVRSHEPFIFEAGRTPDDPDWTRWIAKRHLEVPTEEWNTLMHANSAYLADWRARDGHFYLFYAGASEPTADGRGMGQIGVVRSRDLVNWKLPGDSD